MFTLTAASPRGHSFARRPLTLIRLALAARRQRNALANMDDAALKDIGVTRRDARAESARPLWDVPANWRR